MTYTRKTKDELLQIIEEQNKSIVSLQSELHKAKAAQAKTSEGDTEAVDELKSELNVANKRIRKFEKLFRRIGKLMLDMLTLMLVTGVWEEFNDEFNLDKQVKKIEKQCDKLGLFE